MARLGNTDINGVAYVKDDLIAYRDIILLSKSGHTPVRITNTSDKLTITRTSDGNNLLDVDNTTIKYKTNKIWHEGNDGSGSGLDADLLDGLHASSFFKKSGDTKLVFAANQYFINSGTHVGNYAANINNSDIIGMKNIFFSASGNGLFFNKTGSHSTDPNSYIKFFVDSNGRAIVNNNHILTKADYGHGKGINADMLDDKHASDFMLVAGGTFTGRVTMKSGIAGHVFTNGALNMSNENITNVNALVFDDECDSANEGIIFPKTGIAGSANASDYNTLRVDGAGNLLVGTKKYLSEMENVPSNAYVALGAMDMSPYMKKITGDASSNVRYTYNKATGRTKIECTGAYWAEIDIPIPASQLGYHFSRICIKCLSYNGTAGAVNAYVGVVSYDKDGNRLSTDNATAYNYLWSGNIPVGEYRAITGKTQGVNPPAPAEADRFKFDPNVAYYKIMVILNYNNPGAGSFELYEFESGLIPFAVHDKLKYMSIGGTGGRPTGTTRINFDGYMYTNRLYGAVWNDYAEYFEKGDTIEPGDVVELDMNSEEERYIKTTESYSSNVVGVCSDEYGQCLGGNGDGHDEENFAPIGLAGRVRVKLIGKAKKGDLLTSSSIPGVAMVANPDVDTRGRIIGKCLENKETEDIQRTRMLIQLS